MPSFLSRAMARALSLALLLAALSLTGAAHAATDTFNGGAVANCVYDSGTRSYACNALSVSNNLTIADGYTVQVNGSATIGGSQQLNMSGSASLQIAGALSLSTSQLNLSGGTLAVAGALTVSTSETSITANISAATIALSSSATTRINGTLSASGSIDFQSGMTVTGLVSAAAISTENQVDVVANMQTGTLSVGNQGSITGNVSASGNVTLANHAIINGDLVAKDVVLNNALAYISGNAAVNSIYLGTKGAVGKVITCTGPGAAGCSCVSDHSHLKTHPVCSNTPPPGAGFDHILITHTGTALTCEPQTVTVTACANAACTPPYYSGNVDVTLSPGGETFPISNGSYDQATVQQGTAGTATLSASADGALHPSTCYNTVDNSTSCTMYFNGVGFKFIIPEHRADQAQTLTIRALKDGGGNSSGNVCVPLLTDGTQKVNFNCVYNNPGTGFVPVRVAGVDLGAKCNASGNSGGADIDLTFNSNGEAQVQMQYADAGLVTLNATLKPPNGPYAGLVLTGYANFIAAPARFLFTIKANGKDNPAASNETGGVFTGAGQPFDVALAAVNVNNAVTRNFGHESPAQNYSVVWDLVAPAGGHKADVANFTAVQSAAMVDGATPSASMSWNEVGIISFTAALANGYLGSTMGMTDTVNIGRFIPDHFDTALNGSVPMPCPVNPAFGTPCPAPNAGGKFVYAKQPFDVMVKAYSLSGAATQNYEGSYAKQVTLAAYNGLGSAGTTLNPNADTSVTPPGLNSPTVAAARFVQGVATADPADATSLHAYPLAAGYTAPVSGQPLPPAPTPPTNIWLRASDTDGATSLRAGPPSNEALVTVVNGRQLVGNSYGSEALPMPVVVQAQYWNGTGWLNNPAYGNAAPVALTNKLTFSNCQKNLANSGTNTCAVTFTLANDKLSFTGGVGKFTVAAPVKSGSVDITLNKNGTEAIPFLPSTTGRATFGVYRAGPVVYLREVY
ncbi:MAG: polymer-forming cytoskeletal protein [Pseudomonadota bacterium]